MQIWHIFGDHLKKIFDHVIFEVIGWGHKLATQNIVLALMTFGSPTIHIVQKWCIKLFCSFKSYNRSQNRVLGKIGLEVGTWNTCKSRSGGQRENFLFWLEIFSYMYMLLQFNLLRLLSPVHPVDSRRSLVDWRRSLVDCWKSRVDCRKWE